MCSKPIFLYFLFKFYYKFTSKFTILTFVINFIGIFVLKNINGYKIVYKRKVSKHLKI